MKYLNFKRYKFKFSTIFKNINFLRYKFITFYKDINLRKYRFSKIYKFIGFRTDILSKTIEYFDPRRYNFYKVIKYFDLSKYNFSKVIKYFDPRRYNFYKVIKYFDLSKYNFSKVYKYFVIKTPKYLFSYLASAIFLSAFIYLIMPSFYKYEKSKFENIVCQGFNFKCVINGKINYTFFPSPRIKFSNFIIKNLSEKENILVNAENAVIKISLFKLYDEEKFSYTSIELNKAEINLDVGKFEEYKKFYYKKFNFKPIKLKKGKINFFENEKYITNIENIKFNHKFNKDITKIILKGKFLNDKLYIKFLDEKTSKIITLKLLNTKLLAKLNIFNKLSKDDPIVGNVLLKKNKNRLTGTFNYKDSKLIFKKANLQNFFLDGKFDGKVVFLPYFNFELNVDLNSINFSKFHNFLINLDDERKKKLFAINKKINGQLNLSGNKIYSKYNLIESFESRIKFINGNIAIEQLLFNLGKLGAADLLGHIKNDGKFINLKFENNIFIDSQKYFFRKFGIYNKENISSNLFISGNVDLVNLNINFYEISVPENKQFTQQDIDYIEKEFNDLVFEDGYVSFFNFLKLKEYIKLIMTEEN